ncbi:MAG: hypothetical protein NTY02_10050, partial [Acidobacteria bacterium]|nr:hypothetical protein [Acidobacteriota bacterium]
MFGLLALGALLLFGVMLLGVVGAVLKLVFWLVLLPLRVAGKLVALPFIAFGLFVKMFVGVLLLPLVAVGGLVALVGLGLAAVFALLLPLLPLVIAGLLVWGLVKRFSRPAVVPASQDPEGLRCHHAVCRSINSRPRASSRTTCESVMLY